ncbi:MAG: tripartite tricarboxylate transporter TctB family protein [Rhizobium sp.]|nr:tripartite tricarboxylate transporter TctB family protein [Rhizobium sp.]
MDATTKRNRHDVVAGGIFIAIAAFFAIQGARYEFGTAIKMGPGFFPVVLAFFLGALGVAVIFGGLRKPAEVAAGPVPWRAILLISLALALFAAGARTLGLVPLVFLCTAITALASPKNTAISAIIMGLVMAGLCYLVFKIGLAVTIPTFGPVFGF